MSADRYALGLVALLCVITSLGAGAVGLRALLQPQLGGAVARLAEVVLGVALLTGILEILGAVGLFTFAPVVVVSVAVGLSLSLSCRAVAARGRSVPRPHARRFGGWRVAIPMMAVTAVIAEWMGPTVQSYGQGILGLDSVWYHLPLAASFAQTGQITSIRFTDVEYLTGFYTATSELVHAFGIVLIGDDVLSPAINLVWLGLALFAAWCVGESRAVGSASLVGGALALAVPMMVFSNAGSADGDVAGVGGFWYLRNLIAVGNPFPWFSLGGLPTPEMSLQQHTGFTVADYLVTPGTAAGPFGHPVGFRLNLRYAAPALALALTIGPLALLGAGKRWQRASLCGLAAIFAATIAQRRLFAGPYGPSGLLVPAALLLTAGGAGLALWALARSGAVRTRVAAGVGAAVVLLGGATAGFADQHRYLRDRYAGGEAPRSFSPLWKWARTVRHARIALVGTLGGFFAYPLLGIDDSNDIDYVGHHGPHGAFTPITNCREWRRTLNAGHYRYVVTTASRNVWTHALSFSPEGNWTRGDPAARSVISPAAGAPVAVYGLRGRLDPDRCPASARSRQQSGSAGLAAGARAAYARAVLGPA